MRSFFEKPGLRYSNLARMRPSSPRVMRESSTSGVLPIAPKTESRSESCRELFTVTSFDESAGNTVAYLDSRFNCREHAEVSCLFCARPLSVLSVYRFISNVEAHCLTISEGDVVCIQNQRDLTGS